MRPFCGALLGLLVLTPRLGVAAPPEPGDVAIVGLWADAIPAPKSFAVVTLVPLDPFTVISFTDNGYLTGGGDTFRVGEGVTTFAVGAGGLPAGTVIVQSGANAGFDLSTTGDQVFAFLGTIDGGTGALTGTLLWGVNDEGTPGAWQATATTANNSGLPPSLASHSIALTERDNYAYTGPLSGTKAALHAALRDPANWTGSDSEQPSFPTVFTVLAPQPVPALAIETSIALAVQLTAALLVALRRKPSCP